MHETSRPQVELFQTFNTLSPGIAKKKKKKKIYILSIGRGWTTLQTRESLLFLFFLSTLYIRPSVHVVSVNETGNSLCTRFSWIMGVLSRPTSPFWNGLSLEQMHARRNHFSFLFTGIFGEPWEKGTRIAKHCKVWSGNEHVQNVGSALENRLYISRYLLF